MSSRSAKWKKNEEIQSSPPSNANSNPQDRRKSRRLQGKSPWQNTSNAKKPRKVRVIPPSKPPAKQQSPIPQGTNSSKNLVQTVQNLLETVRIQSSNQGQGQRTFTRLPSMRVAQQLISKEQQKRQSNENIKRQKQELNNLLRQQSSTKAFHMKLNSFVNRIETRQVPKTNQQKQSVKSQRIRLVQFLTLLKRLGANPGDGKSNEFYEIEDETLRSFTMLNSRLPLHTHRKVEITLNQTELAEFLCILYLDSIHDMKRHVEGERGNFLNDYPLERFLNQIFNDKEYLEGILPSLNPGLVKQKFNELIGPFAKMNQTGFIDRANVRTSEFLTLLFRSERPVFVRGASYTDIRAVSTFEEDALRAAVHLATNRRNYRKRTFPINELPKRKTSRILVDMSSTGAVRFFAQKSQQVLSLPSLADEGIVMMKEMDVIERIKSHWRKENRNISRNVSLENITNDIQNRLVPNQTVAPDNAKKFQNVLKKLSNGYYDQTFYYYRMLNMMNRQQKRKTGNKSNISWQLEELRRFLKTMNNDTERRKFKALLDEFMNTRRRNILDTGRFTVVISAVISGTKLNIFSADMDLNTQAVLDPQTKKKTVERIYLGNHETDSWMRNEAFYTSIWSAGNAYDIVGKYKESKKEDVSHGGIYKAVMSKFLGDFCQYMFALTNTFTCPSFPELSSPAPSIFASGDRMTGVGYLWMHHILHKQTSPVTISIPTQIKTYVPPGPSKRQKRAPNVQAHSTEYLEYNTNPIPVTLDPRGVSLAYEDASVFAVNEITKRRYRE